jgi:hypothetical protein
VDDAVLVEVRESRRNSEHPALPLRKVVLVQREGVAEAATGL